MCFNKVFFYSKVPCSDDTVIFRAVKSVASGNIVPLKMTKGLRVINEKFLKKHDRFI